MLLLNLVVQVIGFVLEIFAHSQKTDSCNLLKCHFIPLPPAQPSRAVKAEGTISSLELKNPPTMLLFVPYDICLDPECFMNVLMVTA